MFEFIYSQYSKEKKAHNGTMKHRNSLLIWLIVVVAICAAYFFVMFMWFPGNMEKRGQFGDMFGFLGALFSGLAFAGLIVTIRQQREDLKNQRDEIELQREDLKAQTEALKLQKEEIQQTNEELKLQREEMKAQNRTIMLQRFETTFFNMLSSQMEIRNSVEFSEHRGKDAIFGIFQNYTSAIRRYGNSVAREYGYDELLLKQYLDHFYRHLIQTLKMIDTADFLSVQEKYYYSEIMSSHMSIYELGVFLYYCLSDEGKTTAKKLAESLALFKCLKDSNVIPQEELSHFF